MVEMEQNWADERAEELRLTLSQGDDILERDLQGHACQGICRDIVFMGQCDADDSNDINLCDYELPLEKRWPLVVVDRENEHPRKPETPKLETPIRKRSYRNGRGKTKSTIGSDPVVRGSGDVDLVFIDQDEDSCMLAIEVCSSSPSAKISDLRRLQRRGTP